MSNVTEHDMVLPTVSLPPEEIRTKNASDVLQDMSGKYTIFQNMSQTNWTNSFMISEIVMTTTEVIMLIIASLLWTRWRRNYRNQLFMQLSLIRVAKRVILYLIFINKEPSKCMILLYFRIYVEIVIVLLVICFIKHMYDTLIIVFVKCKPVNLVRTSLCIWLIPLLISVLGTAVVVEQWMDEWLAYLLVCCLFRWPLIIIGTSVYVIIMYRVLSDKERHFMRGLTIITFLLCLSINSYLLGSDIIQLWCMRSYAVLVSNFLGLILNTLWIVFYSILIIGYVRKKEQEKRQVV